ncbi:ROK family protein [Agromyces sp. SYSU T00194]|uniref:ROK family protein n=1 Tax=Agromyces chitinivorans TaxID=3158560 RepID=UPI003391E71E
MTVRGNNLEAVRRHNLATVLRLVHHGGGLPRSQLTRDTGLNRSTVAALVGELVELGLVTEREPAATARVGRPSPTVVPREDVAALAVNPEIDAVELALVGLGGAVLGRARHPIALPTPEDVAAVVRLQLDDWGRGFAGTRVTAIGAAVPGLVRRDDGLVRHAPHLGWRDAPLAEMLGAATGLPASAANDARLGAQAERVFGAGRGVDDLVYVNGGASGIGAGVVSGGRPLGGAIGYAGELGHMRIGDAPARDSAGLAGTLEALVRRDALLAHLGAHASRDDDSRHTPLARLEAAVAAGPSTALAGELRAQAEALGTALGNAVNLFDPSLVLLGGFLGVLLDAAADELRGALARTALAASADAVRLDRPALGVDILAIGAAEIAFETVLGDPAGAAG